MVKVLSVSFEKCFVPFTVLLVEGFSETALFRHLSNHVFQDPKVQKHISIRSYFFSKIFKLKSKLRTFKKKFRKFFISNIIYLKMLQ